MSVPLAILIGLASGLFALYSNRDLWLFQPEDDSGDGQEAVSQ